MKRATNKMLLPALAAATIVSGAAAAETITYRYDARGRLVQVERRAAPTATPVVTRYTHDAANNRTNKIVSGAP
jgi:YD repeat-containing protein